MMGFTCLNLGDYKNKMSNNLFPDSDWKSIYKEKNISFTPEETSKDLRINIIFEINMERTINIFMDHEKTMSELIRSFFKRIGVPELFNRGGCYFIYQAQIIDYNDKTKIINYFKGSQSPVIFVNDIRKLIGSKYGN